MIHKKTLVSASSIEEIKSKKKKMEKSTLIGEVLAKQQKKKILFKFILIEALIISWKSKTFAETLRKNGLKF